MLIFTHLLAALLGGLAALTFTLWRFHQEERREAREADRLLNTLLVGEVIPPMDEMDENDDPCWNCEGAGCNECDGTPLTDEEVEEQLG